MAELADGPVEWPGSIGLIHDPPQTPRGDPPQTWQRLPRENRPPGARASHA